jgi:prevent-host-death family protein
VSWQLQDAKNRLSEVVNLANERGPQIITRHGEEVAVVLSYDDWKKLAAKPGKLSEFFQSSPLKGLIVERDKTALRDSDEFSS